MLPENTPHPMPLRTCDPVRIVAHDTPQRLYYAIAHGSDDHRAWLREAIEAFFDGHAIPQERR